MAQFEGDWKEIEFRLLSIFENGPNSSWVSQRRAHHNLWIVLEGAAHFTRGNQVHAVAAGDAWLLAPDEPVEWSTGRRDRLVNFAAHLVGPPGFAAACAPLAAAARPWRLPALAWVGPLCRHLSELFYLGRARHRAEIEHGLGLLLLSLESGAASASENLPDRRLLDVVERIRRDPGGVHGVEELAAAAGWSSSQLNRRFKVFTGLTTNRFVIEERLQLAERYLEETDLPMKQVAERCGYADGYFFSRQFRRFRGHTPTDHRQKRRRRSK